MTPARKRASSDGELLNLIREGLQEPRYFRFSSRTFTSMSERAASCLWDMKVPRDALSRNRVVYGWLWKLGSTVKTWKKRFFVLRSTELAYYKSCTIVSTAKLGTKEFKKKPKGTVTIVHAERSNRTEFGLKITCEGRRELYVQADSVQTRDLWLRALSKSVCVKPLKRATSAQYERHTTTPVSALPNVYDIQTGWALVKAVSPTSSPAEKWERRFLIFDNGRLSSHRDDRYASEPLADLSGLTKSIQYEQDGIYIALEDGKQLVLDIQNNKSAWREAFDRRTTSTLHATSIAA